MIITDKNSNQPLMRCNLPDDFRTEGYLDVQQHPLNLLIKTQIKAERGSCGIYYQSGDGYTFTKYKQNIYYNGYAQPAQQGINESGYYVVGNYIDVQTMLDSYARQLSSKTLKATDKYNLSKTFYTRIRQDFSREMQKTFAELQQGASISSTTVSTIVRNYLLDGGLNVYEDDGKLLAICLYQFGIETDVIMGPPTVSENLSAQPFAQAEITPGCWTSYATWNVPAIYYMITDNRNDLSIFMNFIDTAVLTDNVLAYADQLRKQVNEYQAQVAMMQSMQTQQMINNLWQQNNDRWAASDRLRKSLSEDLDNFHNDLNQRMAHSDARFTSSSSGQFESYDDRIQRLRHESMMGVETYERNDGTTVEFDNRSDRVFENNLDSTQQFGTYHYYDNYVPEGWHELNKKK